VRLTGLAALLALTFATASCSPPEPAKKDVDAPTKVDDAPVLEAQAPPAARAQTRRSAPREESAGGYQYIDETGRVRIAASLDQVPERQRSTATALAAQRARPARAGGSDEPVETAQRADVTIYTTPGCGWCRKAMAYFDSKGIDYQNRDITADEAAYAEYDELTSGRSGVPVIVVGEDWMQGWSQGRFDEMLAAAN
jgi:glutaredoxin